MTDLSDLLDRVSRRAAADPDAVIPVLRALAGDAHDDGEAWHDTVTTINRDRILADRRAFMASAWPTERVAAHLGVASRQAVAQRRARGTLIGATIGTQTWYPAWQFDAEGIAPGLPRLLAALREADITDARTADDLLRMKHSGLRRSTLLEVWRRGDWDTLTAWLGDVGGWRR